MRKQKSTQFFRSLLTVRYIWLWGYSGKGPGQKKLQKEFLHCFGSWAMSPLANSMCTPMLSPHHSWASWCPRNIKVTKFQPLVPTLHSYNSQVTEYLIPSPEYGEDSESLIWLTTCFELLKWLVPNNVSGPSLQPVIWNIWQVLQIATCSGQETIY